MDSPYIHHIFVIYHQLPFFLGIHQRLDQGPLGLDAQPQPRPAA